jgi:hypothetical protein
MVKVNRQKPALGRLALLSESQTLACESPRHREHAISTDCASRCSARCAVLRSGWAIVAGESDRYVGR